MDVANEKKFLETKRKMLLKKIQQDYKAQKSYEVKQITVVKLIYVHIYLPNLNFS